MSTKIEQDPIFKNQQNLLNLLLKFTSSLVFNSKAVIDLFEDNDSLTSWKILESDFNSYFNNTIIDYKTQIDEYINNSNSSILANYNESNPKVLEIIERFNNCSYKSLPALTPIHVRLMPNITFFAWDSSYTLDENLMAKFKKNLIAEEEYLRTLYGVDYYKTSELYINLSIYMISVSAIIRTMSDVNFPNITFDLRNINILNNYLASFGFLLFDKVPLMKKAEFAINIIKLYKTKGTKENIKMVSEIFSTSKYNKNKIYNLYLYFDEQKWNSDGQPTNDLSPYYYFFKVDELNGETFNSVYNREKDSLDRKMLMQDVVNNDPTWKVTENELFQRNIKFIKSKYLFIENNLDLTEFSKRVSFLINFLKYGLELNTNNFQQIREEKFKKIFDDYLVLVSALNKKCDVNFDVSNLNLHENQNGKTFSLDAFEYSNINYTLITSISERLNTLYDELNRVEGRIKYNFNNISSFKQDKSTIDSYKRNTNYPNLENVSLDFFEENYNNSTLFTTIKNNLDSEIANEIFVDATNKLSFSIENNKIVFEEYPVALFGSFSFSDIIDYFSSIHSSIFTSDTKFFVDDVENILRAMIEKENLNGYFEKFNDDSVNITVASSTTFKEMERDDNINISVAEHGREIKLSLDDLKPRLLFLLNNFLANFRDDLDRTMYENFLSTYSTSDKSIFVTTQEAVQLISQDSNHRFINFDDVYWFENLRSLALTFSEELEIYDKDNLIQRNLFRGI